MSESEPRQPKPEPLNYATPSRSGGMPYVAQVAIGFGATLAWAVFTGLTASFLETIVPAYQTTFNVTLLAGLAVFVAINVIAWRRWRGFVVGVLITIGLAVLACGLGLALHIVPLG